ncbi:DUF1883 domain-containing protein [Amycolatopsis sp. lyj-112]|uniref:DUF1883 domain-containing protein n=1 Tax=Amycolatopsis sp. lyj-112 TaxID=2789288 RepID=UPI003978A822
MQFHTWDLGQRSAGNVVEVSLTGNAANVMLLDSSNLAARKAGRNYRASGGHVTRSPVRLTVPSNGHWYLAVDYGGAAGSSRVSHRVLAA